ncbi:MAG TPA: DUF5985 family protein [Candidatus Polarisedimenticolaceae bacterium]|nr:DUF5985 family protein [Candidatus Polarisedimenticolaceae bacterium]
MAEAVYVLCALTSAACAYLLIASYRQTRSRLLFWSGLCFLGLALNNVLLFIDLVVVPSSDLGIWRSELALASLGLLVLGLVWESH